MREGEKKRKSRRPKGRERKRERRSEINERNKQKLIDPVLSNICSLS